MLGKAYVALWRPSAQVCLHIASVCRSIVSVCRPIAHHVALVRPSVQVCLHIASVCRPLASVCRPIAQWCLSDAVSFEFCAIPRNKVATTRWKAVGPSHNNGRPSLDRGRPAIMGGSRRQAKGCRSPFGDGCRHVALHGGDQRWPALRAAARRWSCADTRWSGRQQILALPASNGLANGVVGL